MQLKKVKIKDYSGLTDIEVFIQNNLMYIVSDNNVGKTRTLKAIDNFFNGKDNANLEITYEFTQEEIKELNSKHNLELSEESTFIQKDKKILFNNNDYTSFIRNKKILGQCFYIPTIVNFDDQQDLSKAKNQLSSVIIDLISDDDKLKKSMVKLNKDYNNYVKQIKEKSKNMFLNINDSILFDDFNVSIDGTDINGNQLIKSNLYLDYSNSSGPIDLNKCGTGVQSNIINSILTNFPRKQYTIILYDEPESYLNSTAQKKLINKINNNINNSLYIIVTHSPFIIKRSVDTFKSIIRLQKKNSNAIVYQYNDIKYKKYVKNVNEFLQKSGLTETKYLLKDDIYKTILTWWETDRVNALFENKIVLVEGPTESIFFDICCSDNNYCVVNTIGKWKIPYFKIFYEDILGIKVMIIYDKDDEKKTVHKSFNSWIMTTNYFLENDIDLENKLGYKSPKNQYMKPQMLIENYLNNKIDINKINALKITIENEYKKMT